MKKLMRLGAYKKKRLRVYLLVCEVWAMYGYELLLTNGCISWVTINFFRKLYHTTSAHFQPCCLACRISGATRSSIKLVGFGRLSVEMDMMTTILKNVFNVWKSLSQLNSIWEFHMVKKDVVLRLIVLILPSQIIFFMIPTIDIVMLAYIYIYIYDEHIFFFQSDNILKMQGA